MLLLWFTIVDHCCEIQAVDKMDSWGEKQKVRGHSSPRAYLLFDKLCQVLHFPSPLSLSEFPFLLRLTGDYLTPGVQTEGRFPALPGGDAVSIPEGCGSLLPVL